MNGLPADLHVRPATRAVAALLVPVAGRVRLEVIPADLAPGGWRWPVRWVDTAFGQQVLWCGERRRVQELPANGSAWVLAARLGYPDLADRIGLNGDLLVTGVSADGHPADVPDQVTSAAQRAGLLGSPIPGRKPPNLGDVWPAGLRADHA